MLELKILPYPLEEVKIINRVQKFLPPTDMDSLWEEGTVLTPISSSKGKIKKLLFILPKDAQVKIKYNFFPVLKELIAKMNQVEQFIFIYRGYELDLDKDFDAWLKAHPRVKLETIKNEEGELAPDSELSIWAQDHFYTLKALSKNASHPQIYGMIGNLDSNFRFALERVVANRFPSTDPAPFKLKKTGLPFEGGNILVGENFILVGEQDWYPDAYKKWFGKAPIFVHTSTPPPRQATHLSKDNMNNTFPVFPTDSIRGVQPLFHLDLFLTLVGYNSTKTSYTLVVGQPELGVEHIKHLDHEFYLFMNQWLTQMQASISSCIEHLKTNFSNILNVELKIVSIPLVLTYNDKITANRQEREWFWATYNNCLVEQDSTSKKVWLPSYGNPITSNYSNKPVPEGVAAPIQRHLPRESSIQYGDWSFLEKYDKASQFIWEALGFEVCLLEQNYLPFARQHGSLNCFSNCIERE